MIKKIIAKKIIVSAPFSTSELGQFLELHVKIPVRSLDFSIQSWALTQSDCFSEEDWQEVQFKKIKKILCHAEKNVLHWRVLFKKIGFDPIEMKNIDELKKIPISTRAELKKIPLEDLLARNIPKTRFVPAATSGSTGEPFSFYQDKRDLFRRCINTDQEMRYLGITKGDSILRIGLKEHSDLDEFGAYFSPRDLESKQKRDEIIYPLLVTLQPRLIISAPSCLERFLFYCGKDNFRPKIEKLYYMGEQMNSHTKERLESFFGAQVYMVYGAKETSLIGIQCKNRSLHFAPWMNFVEIIDGQIVITTFENEAMPFIRYAVGDESTLLENFCECGRKSKIMEFNGRATFGALEFADGSQYQISYFIQHLAAKYSGKIRKFQFEQVSHQELQMRYIPTLPENCERIEKELREYFRSIFEDRLEILFQSVESILPNAAGKVPPFIKKISK